MGKEGTAFADLLYQQAFFVELAMFMACLLYTSDAADE